MASFLEDQAAGLRKLFSGSRGPATIAFAGAGSRGGLVAGLARGLASAGKEVVVIDEHAGADNVAAAFGLRLRYDLLQAVNRDVPAAQVLLRAETSIRLLPAARAARLCARLDAIERRALGEWLRRLQKRVDYVLVDTADRAEGEFSPLLPQPQRIVIAASPEAPSITEAYAQMKRLVQLRDCRRFEVVIQRAATTAEGQTVFGNLREVARRHLGAELDLLGCSVARSEPQHVGHALAEALLGPSREAAGKGFVIHSRESRRATAAYPVV